MAQPSAQLPAIGKVSGHFPPVGGGVVGMQHVAEFMDHEIIQYGRRRHDDPPVEADGAAGGTTAQRVF